MKEWEKILLEGAVVGVAAGAIGAAMSGGSHRPRHRQPTRNVQGEIAGHLAQAQIAPDDAEKGRLYGLVLELESGNAQARTGLADILEKQDRCAWAAEHLAAVSNPSVELRLRTANLYARDPGRHTEAARRYSELMQDRYLNPVHLGLVAEAYFDFCVSTRRDTEAARLFVDRLKPVQRTQQRHDQFAALASRLVNVYQVAPATYADCVLKRGWLELLSRGADRLPLLANQIRNILSSRQFQLVNNLKIERKTLLDILLRVIGENEPCFCGLFEPKYAKLRGLLRPYLGRDRSSHEIVDVVEFISRPSEHYPSIAYLLQARVLGANGEASEAWQQFIDGLNKHSLHFGNVVSRAPGLAKPADKLGPSAPLLSGPRT